MVNFSNGMEDSICCVPHRQHEGGLGHVAVRGCADVHGHELWFGNALQMLQTGKATFTKAGKEGLDLVAANRKQNTKEAMQQAAALNDAWTNVFENPVETAAITPPAVMNPLNYGARYVLVTSKACRTTALLATCLLSAC